MPPVFGKEDNKPYKFIWFVGSPFGTAFCLMQQKLI